MLFSRDFASSDGDDSFVVPAPGVAVRGGGLRVAKDRRRVRRAHPRARCMRDLTTRRAMDEPGSIASTAPPRAVRE